MTEETFNGDDNFSAHNLTYLTFDNKQPIFNISPHFLSAFIYTVTIMSTPIVCGIDIATNGIGKKILSKVSVRNHLTFNIYLKALFRRSKY